MSKTYVTRFEQLWALQSNLPGIHALNYCIDLFVLTDYVCAGKFVLVEHFSAGIFVLTNVFVLEYSY
jgi:hypothetical protein